MESEQHRRSKRIVAVCGKGGTGKTAFTAMMRTVLLQTGRAGKLLLIDADPAMGLMHALGVGVRRTMGQVREEIIATAQRRREEEKVQLADKLDYMTFEALTELDDFALLAMGRTETLGCYCPVNSLLRGTIETLSESFDTILIDGEAGVEQINRQVMRRADTMMIISDATSRGIQTAGLIKELVQGERVIDCDRLGLVFNRVQGNEDLLEKSALEMGLEVFGYIPQDEEIAYHDLLGKPLTDLPDASRALAAVRETVETHVLR
jgi:CO dehydrogenase maturation factor